MSASTKIPCPFVYAGGRRCAGYVVRVEVYKTDIAWEGQPEGGWIQSLRPRSHFHVFCSEKDNHAGFRRRDADGMKFYYDQLPEELRLVIDRSAQGA